MYVLVAREQKDLFLVFGRHKCTKWANVLKHIACALVVLLQQVGGAISRWFYAKGCAQGNRVFGLKIS